MDLVEISKAPNPWEWKPHIRVSVDIPTRACFIDNKFPSGSDWIIATIQAYRRATPGEGRGMKGDLPSWRGFFKDYSRRAVEEAVQTMFFDDLR